MLKSVHNLLKLLVVAVYFVLALCAGITADQVPMWNSGVALVAIGFQSVRDEFNKRCQKDAPAAD